MINTITRCFAERLFYIYPRKDMQIFVNEAEDTVVKYFQNLLGTFRNSDQCSYWEDVSK